MVRRPEKLMGLHDQELFRYGYGELGLAWLLHFIPILFMSFWM